MSLSATNVPVANGWPNEDIFTAVMEERQQDPTVEIKVNHPLYYYYQENGLIEKVSDWGPYKPVKILAKENTTVKDFAHYEDMDDTPQDALDEAKFGNGYFGGRQTYSFQEMLEASSKDRILDLAKVKEQQLTETMGNHFGDLIVGSQDANGKQSMGIGRIMAYNQTCGGIDPTQPGFAYWNPQRGLKADGSSFSLATEFRAGLRRLERLCTYNFETPEFWLCGEDVYEAWCAFSESKVGFVLPSDMKKQKEWTDFRMAKDQLGRIYVYDKALAAKEAWLINTKRTKIRVHTGAYMSYQPWEKHPTKEAKRRSCLTAYTVWTERRNANGRILFT